MPLRYPIPRSDALRYPFSGDRGRFWGSGGSGGAGWTDADGLVWDYAWDFTAVSAGSSAIPALAGGVDLTVDSGSYGVTTPTGIDATNLGLAANSAVALNSANLSAVIPALETADEIHIRYIARINSTLGEVFQVGTDVGWHHRSFITGGPSTGVFSCQLRDGGSNVAGASVAGTPFSDYIIIDYHAYDDGGTPTVDMFVDGSDTNITGVGTYGGVSNGEVRLSDSPHDGDVVFLAIRRAGISLAQHNTSRGTLAA